MADAATFTECRTGQRWLVAMEQEYKALESAYLKARGQPGKEMLVELEGKVTMRPNMDTGRPAPTLVVERYIGIRRGESCSPR